MYTEDEELALALPTEPDRAIAFGPRDANAEVEMAPELPPDLPRWRSFLWLISHQAKRLKWHDWAGVGAVSLFLILVVLQWSPARKPDVGENPLYSVTHPPAYDEAQDTQDVVSELGKSQRRFWTFANEERQRTIVGLAQNFLALAAYYQSQPTHRCGRYHTTTLGCLNTFWDNRKDEISDAIDEASVHGKFAPGRAIAQQLHLADDAQKSEALMLATILATPVDLRTKDDAWVLTTFFPVLDSGLGAVQVTQRPAILLRRIQAVQDSDLALRATSPEEQAETERSAKLAAQCQEENRENLKPSKQCIGGHK